MTLKQKAHAAFIELLQGKIDALHAVLTDLFESAKNETKSTAGDKHETALAHLQIEQQKTRNQLSELQLQMVLLQSIDPTNTSSVVRKGSLIETNKNSFFICGGLGKIILDDKIIFAISELSPIGIKMMGKEIDAQIEMNGVYYTLINIS